MMNHRKQKLIEYASRLGLSYHAVGDRPPAFSWYLTDGGLCTTSRFAIVDRDFKPYKYGFASDSLSYKGLLYTKILIQGCALHLFQTHMQASYFGTDADSFVSFKIQNEGWILRHKNGPVRNVHGVHKLKDGEGERHRLDPVHRRHECER